MLVLADARFIFLCQNEHVFCECGIFNYSCTDNEPYVGPPGVWGIWGEGLFIFRDLGSTGNYFRGAGKQAPSFGIKRALPKSKL